MTTATIQATTHETGYTPASFRAACRAALSAARTGELHSEHHAGRVVYVVAPRGIVRLEKGPDGQTISERRVA